VGSHRFLMAPMLRWFRLPKRLRFQASTQRSSSQAAVAQVNEDQRIQGVENPIHAESEHAAAGFRY